MAVSIVSCFLAPRPMRNSHDLWCDFRWVVSQDSRVGRKFTKERKQRPYGTNDKVPKQGYDGTGRRIMIKADDVSSWRSLKRQRTSIITSVANHMKGLP